MLKGGIGWNGQQLARAIPGSLIGMRKDILNRSACAARTRRFRRYMSTAVVLTSGIGTLYLLGCGPDVAVPSGECDAELQGSCWVNLGLEGGEIWSLAQTEWGLFAGTRNAGLFYFTADRGEWTSVGLDDASVTALLFVPATPQRLLVGTLPDPNGGGPEVTVWATEDTGQTWVAWDRGLNEPGGVQHSPFSFAYDPTNPDRLHMGTSFPILRSTDGGRTWQYVLGTADDFGNGVRAILVAPSADGRLWAAVTASSRGFVWRSTDWGDSWAFTELVPFQLNHVSDIAISEGLSSTLWAATGRGVVKSVDDGATWITSMDAPAGFLALVGSTLYAAAVDGPVDGRYLLALRSTNDGGATWQPVPTPPDLLAASSMIADDLGIIVRTRGSGVWRLTLRP